VAGEIVTLISSGDIAQQLEGMQILQELAREEISMDHNWWWWIALQCVAELKSFIIGTVMAPAKTAEEQKPAIALKESCDALALLLKNTSQAGFLEVRDPLESIQ
jgi:hypothetical protein